MPNEEHYNTLSADGISIEDIPAEFMASPVAVTERTKVEALRASLETAQEHFPNIIGDFSYIDKDFDPNKVGLIEKDKPTVEGFRTAAAMLKVTLDRADSQLYAYFNGIVPASEDAYRQDEAGLRAQGFDALADIKGRTADHFEELRGDIFRILGGTLKKADELNELLHRNYLDNPDTIKMLEKEEKKMGKKPSLLEKMAIRREASRGPQEIRSESGKHGRR